MVLYSGAIETTLSDLKYFQTIEVIEIIKLELADGSRTYGKETRSVYINPYGIKITLQKVYYVPTIELPFCSPQE